MVTAGIAVAAVTALPALGVDLPRTGVAAQANVGQAIGAGAAEAPWRAGANRDSGTATTDDGWDYFDDTPIAGLVAASLGPATSTSVAMGTTGTEASSLAANGIPDVTLRAYQAAAAALAVADPSCRLDWTLLAGIGRVESNHGRFAGAVVTPTGVSVPSVIGIRLDGTMAGTKVIVDSDAGRLDGDTAYDRAVGPMQFLPGSWVMFGADADGDGIRNPQDIDDAALAAGAFLCSGNDDLSTVAGASAAVRRYNNSGSYVTLVLSLASAYKGLIPLGAIPVVPAAAVIPVLPETPTVPAAPPVPLGLTPDPTQTPSPTTSTTTPGATSSGSTSSSDSPTDSSSLPSGGPTTSPSPTSGSSESSTPPASSTSTSPSSEPTTPSTTIGDSSSPSSSSAADPSSISTTDATPSSAPTTAVEPTQPSSEPTTQSTLSATVTP